MTPTTPTTWQPIATAPRDRAILLWDNHFQQCVVARAYGPHHWFIEESYGPNDDGEIPIKDATHWMPLPEPPDAPTL